MKLFPKFLLAALFIAIMLPFTILKGPDGNTLMSLSDFELPDFSMQDLPKMPSGGNMSPSPEGFGRKDIFYQWNDADGNPQFTTDPPPPGVEYIVKAYDPDTNVIQAVKLPEEESESSAPAGETQKQEGIGNPYNPEKIEKLFEDAKNVEKLLQQRVRDQEAALNQ